MKIILFFWLFLITVLILEANKRLELILNNQVTFIFGEDAFEKVKK